MIQAIQHLQKSASVAQKFQTHYDFLIRVIDDPFPKLDELAAQMVHQANEEKTDVINIVMRAMENADKAGNGDYITFFAAAYVHLTKLEYEREKIQLQNETSSNI